MNGPITTFWGKLLVDADGQTVRDKAGAPVAWHPLVDHCADVAACFRGLLDQPVIRHRLARLAGRADLDPVLCDRLGFFAALHDFGKVNMGFWNHCLPKPPFTAGHLAPVLTLSPGTSAAERIISALDLAPLADWVGDEYTINEFLLATISHHGQPLAPHGFCDPRLWRRSGSLDPAEGVAELRRSAADWFPRAFERADPIPTSTEFLHAFNGLLTLADWIGSDPDAFPFSGELRANRFAWSVERARIVLRRLGLVATEPRESLGPGAPTFTAVSAHEPRDLQRRIMELPVGPEASLTVLEAETGSGKTEAAIARFLQLFHAGLVDGMYFALPTRSAATQIHGRVVRAVERAFPEHARPPVIMAVPGYLAVDDVVGSRADRFRVAWDSASPVGEDPIDSLPLPYAAWNDDDRPRRYWRGWAAEHPKRYLAGAIVVGTVDQALLAALAVPHSHMRAAALLRHLLVVDEVHASDAYMTRILEEVLARHLAAGGHALLMSATLGAAARDRLLSLISRPVRTSLADAASTPYPLISHAVAGESPISVRVLPSRERTISIDRVPIIDDPKSLARRMLEAARDGARVLAIRNTVQDCIALQRELETTAHAMGLAGLLFGVGGVPAPHHSRFSREDRQALDRALEERFRLESPSGGCVAAATQTVEQSLDIDADLLFTDLCPIDVLLQRLGRLHRHDRVRPSAFVQARAVVLVPEDRNLGRWIRKKGEARGPHGIGTVYDDLRILEATWQLLETHPDIEVPSMCRELVEQATHRARLVALANELGSDWETHHIRIEGARLADRRIGGLNLARWDVPFSDPDALFPSGRTERDIATRLGEDDRLAEFDPAPSGPFGSPVRRLTMPAHLAAGAEPDARVEAVEAVDGAFVFGFGSRRFRYDRFGLRPDHPEHREDEQHE